MPKKLEECVKSVMKEHDYEESRAYAICTAAMKDGSIMMISDVSPALDKFIDGTTGFLHIDGVLARTGIQEYYGYQISNDLERDKIYKVLRHPEDVLDEASIKTYINSPATDDHPEDFVTTENYKELQMGTVSQIETYKKDGIDFVKGRLTIMNKDLINKLKEGKVEISMGYYSSVEDEEGEFLGEKYQFRQRDIIINHAAIVSRGRCGGECRVVIDKKNDIIEDVTSIDEKTNPEKGENMKITIGGVEYEVDEKVAEEFKKLKTEASDQEEKAEEKEKEAEKANATADELKAQLQASKTKDADAKDKDNQKNEVKDMVEIIKVADSMNIEVKVTDADTMKKEILSSKYKDVQFDDKSKEYIVARFDMMVENADKAVKSHEAVVDGFKPGATEHKDIDDLKDKEL